MQGNSANPHLSPRLKCGVHQGTPHTPPEVADLTAASGETVRNSVDTWTPVEKADRDVRPTFDPRGETGSAHDRRTT